MVVGQNIQVSGFVTQLKYLSGHSLEDIGSLLGFNAGRLSMGGAFATLDRLPQIDEFETAGYSQVAAHRHVMPDGLDPTVLRRNAMSAWALAGPNRLIKVMASIPHNRAMSDDEQYPPGLGVPQWKIVVPIPGKVIAVLSRLADAFRMP
jgi:hypothetical protein